MKDPAVALKVALVEPGGIDTVAGTVMLPVDDNATAVAAAAALLRVTVQAATPAGASVDGLQLTLLRTEGTRVPAVPPVAATARELPSRVAPRAPEIPILAEPAVGGNVTDTVATMPSAMRFVLIPVARQMYAVGEPAQVSVLPAAVSAGPAVTLKPVTEAAG